MKTIFALKQEEIVDLKLIFNACNILKRNDKRVLKQRVKRISNTQVILFITKIYTECINYYDLKVWKCIYFS